MVVQWWMNGELVLRWPNELCTTISLLSAFYFKPPFICFQPPTDLSWTPLIALGLAWRVDLFVRCIRLCSYEIILTSVYFSSLLGSGKKCRATGEVRESSKGKKRKRVQLQLLGKSAREAGWIHTSRQSGWGCPGLQAKVWWHHNRGRIKWEINKLSVSKNKDKNKKKHLPACLGYNYTQL